MAFKIEQQPLDIRDYDISFDQWFPVDDVIVEVEVVSVVPSTDGLQLSTAISPDARVVKVWVAGGTDGGRFKVTLLAKTNDGRAKEVELSVTIKDK